MDSLYPSLYRISRNKFALIRDMVKFTDNRAAWDFNFTRIIKEDEEDMVADLLNQINAPALAESGDDFLSWNPGNSFSVKDCYDAIEVAGFLFCGIQEFHKKLSFLPETCVTMLLQH